MSLSAAEQYLLELINRGRLNPVAEAALMGTTLNAGLAPGTISTQSKQVLVANDLLSNAATLHSVWMLSADVFSHTGEGGSTFDGRIEAAGYSGFTYGENIAFVGSTGPITVEGSIEALNRNLFLSAGHRENMMNDAYQEVGLGAEGGQFTQAGTTFNAAMLTEDFGATGTDHFLTGVAYTDSDGDRFYSMGEGGAGVVFAAQGAGTATAAAGGYALSLTPGAAVAVTGHSGALEFSLTVDLRPGNVKLDLVNSSVFYSSGNLTLGTGVQDVVLLGVARLRATGTAQDNALTGNAGANVLSGLDGRDVLAGSGGADTLIGGRGNDRLNGGKGADVFVFGPGEGVDRVVDFSVAAKDHLRLNDTLWTGQILTAAQVVSQFATVGTGEVVFDFGAAELHLSGLASTNGLAALIEIF